MRTHLCIFSQWFLISPSLSVAYTFSFSQDDTHRTELFIGVDDTWNNPAEYVVFFCLHSYKCTVHIRTKTEHTIFSLLFLLSVWIFFSALLLVSMSEIADYSIVFTTKWSTLSLLHNASTCSTDNNAFAFIYKTFYSVQNFISAAKHYFISFILLKRQ